MEPEQRVFPVAGDGLVEFGVVLVFQFGFRSLPQGARRVGLLGGALLDRLLLGLVPLVFVGGEEDREGDVVRVFLDDLAEFVAVGVLLAFLVEVQGDRGAGGRAHGGFEFEARFAVARPAPGGVFAGLAGDDLNAVSDDKRAVEADAELADKVRIPLGIPGKVCQKVLRARPGDGPEMRDEVLIIHPDARIGDAERSGLFVQLEIDARVEGKRLVGLLGEREILQLIERIGGVRDELPKKDLLMRVQRMDNELKQLADFSLKFTF